MKTGISCLLLTYSLTVSGQQRLSYHFRHLDRTTGLLHNEVTAITQDAKGYMWIGTVRGLQRYDGLRFKNYNDDRSSPCFQSEVQSLSAADNFLWLTSSPQTEKLDLTTDRVVRRAAIGETTTTPSFASEVYTDADGFKYLVTDLEVYKGNPRDQKMTLYIASPPMSSSTGLMLKDRDNGRLWMVSPQGLLLADSGTKRIYSAAHNEIEDPLLSAMQGKSASGILVDSHHNTWITSRYNDQLYRYDPARKKLFVYSLADIRKAQGEKTNASILYNNCVFEDNHANIWVATQQAGLLKYNPRQDNFDYVIAAQGSNQSIEYNYNINCIAQDNEENIWVGTDKGINIFNPYRNYFQTIRHEKNNPASLPQNDILDIIQTAEGDVLIATWGGGITVYDSTLTFKKNIRIDGRFEMNMVWCFMQKDKQNIWAGCQHGFLHTYNTTTGKISTIHPEAFENSTIICMQKDKDGNVWFGLHNGKIAKWDSRSDSFLPYKDNTPAATRHFSSVQHIFIDKSNNFWVSTLEGLKQFDPFQKAYTATCVAGAKSNSSVSAAGIQGVGPYNDSILLVGTTNDGLYFFNTRSRSFTRPKPSDGLSAGSVYAIEKDGAGNIWLTTDYHLEQLAPGKRSIVYAIDPDVIHSAFQWLHFYRLRDGRWATGTNAEVFLFDPGGLAQKNKKARVAITGLRLFDHPMGIDSILYTGKPVELTYQQNFVTLEFSTLTFFNIGPVGYRYRLSGVDEDWVRSDRDGVANYTNLRPGKYTFSVKAADDDDDPVTTLSIVITPPWYKEAWFIMLCIAIAGVLIYRWVKLREQSVKDRTMERANAQAIIQEKQMRLDRQQYEMAEAEMNALRAQMNPHFLFNSLNSINNYILKNDADNAAGYLTKFSRLMRLILDNSRSNWVWLQNEVKALQLYAELEAFRFDNSFTYKIDLDADLNALHIMVPPMIIQPYVENAIWHGLMHRQNGGGHLQIDLYKEGANLCVSIQDNGVGRQAAKRMRSKFAESHKSYGMKITAERLELMNKVYSMDATITVDDAPQSDGEATGTVVLIKFKYLVKDE